MGALRTLRKPRLRAGLGPLFLVAALGSQTAIGQQAKPYMQSDREKPLVGYSMVVGLPGTGDRRPTPFSAQILDNIVLKTGVAIPAASLKARNVAAVFVTASLPPSSSLGTQVDVTISAIGDATNLEGGILLLAPLYAADGQVWVEAQGPVTLGGSSASQTGDTKPVDHPAAGRISNGGLVERCATPGAAEN